MIMSLLFTHTYLFTNYLLNNAIIHNSHSISLSAFVSLITQYIFRHTSNANANLVWMNLMSLYLLMHKS
jgi:hypothetical protein